MMLLRPTALSSLYIVPAGVVPERCLGTIPPYVVPLSNTIIFTAAQKEAKYEKR